MGNQANLLYPSMIQILDTYYDMPVPKSGQTLYFQLPGSSRSLTFYCPVCTLASCTWLNRWETRNHDWLPIGSLWQLLKFCLQNIYCNFLQHFFLKNPLLCSAKTFAQYLPLCMPQTFQNNSSRMSAVPLLRPFKWQGLLIPILPSTLHEVLEAPVPFITGTEQSNYLIVQAYQYWQSHLME